MIADKEHMDVEEENGLRKVDFNIGNRWVQRQDRYIERSRDRYEKRKICNIDRCGEMDQRECM